MECPKVPSSGVKKVKKKQVMDELDRMKQAEKKRRRLAKALANSAAIRAELEMKKQKKQEEQQRLDEEGAAIAEAVALQVLLGEDSDSACKFMKTNDEFDPWNCCASNFDVLMDERRKALFPRPIMSKIPIDEICWVLNNQEPIHQWNGCANGSGNGPLVSNLHNYYCDGRWEATEMSAELSAALAVSSLQIAEDDERNTFTF